MAHKAAPKLPRLRMREELLKVLTGYNAERYSGWTCPLPCVDS